MSDEDGDDIDDDLDASIEAERNFKRNLLLSQFRPISPSDTFEIVPNPISDDEEEYERYETSIKLRKLPPFARVSRAHNIRGYDEPRKEEELKDNKWTYRMLINDDQVYEVVNINRRTACHLASILYMKSLIEKCEVWRSQLGLPEDLTLCNQILDKDYEELQSMSKELSEIGKNPQLFLNEFCAFYQSVAQIKAPQYNIPNENQSPPFICNGVFRGHTFSATGESKKEAKNGVAKMFFERLQENDEDRLYLEDQKITKRGKNYIKSVMFKNGEERNTFDEYFGEAPYHYASICNGNEPDIKIDDDEITITCREHASVFKISRTLEDAKNEWAMKFLRKAFVDRVAPEFFANYLPPEMINLVNDAYHEITVPELWENETR